jgi:S1-C subfamily serine protease
MMRELLATVAALAVLNASAGDCVCQDIGSLERDMISVVDRVGESVVSVAAISSGPRAAAGEPVGALRAMSRSVGCGVVFDEDGLVVTTASVVGYARYAEIGTRSGAKYKGTVVGIDPNSDMAVIKVDADIKPARFAEDAELKPGSLVLVMGNAFGSLPSVSMGVVSNVGEAAGGDGSVLRLSVPINPGDIGGPVVNTKGEVVGIVIGRLTFQSQSHAFRIGDRAFVGVSGGLEASNMSIAVPAMRAADIAGEILEQGSSKKGFLGVQVMNLSDEIRLELGSPKLDGVIVTGVVPGSPAESVGMMPGDIITSLGTKEVESVTQLSGIIAEASPGDVVDIRYVRQGSAIDDGVRLGWFVPEFVRQATFVERTLRPGQVQARIQDLKTEIEVLEAQLEELEKKQ